LHSHEFKRAAEQLPDSPFYFVLLKTPNGTDIFVVVLIVVVLIAIVEVLFPRIVVVVLRRTPVPISRKTASINKSVLMFARNLTRI
jgi:hypothetical protein